MTVVMTPPEDAPASDNWALRADLELCGAVPPPSFAGLAPASRQTFDVSDRGVCVLLSDRHELFLLPFFQSPSRRSKPPVAADGADADADADAPVRLLHLELDPALSDAELRAVQCVQLNSTATSVLLRARDWLKVVRLPAEALQLLGLAPSPAEAAALASSSRRRAAPSAKPSAVPFVVRFADGASKCVHASASASRRQLETQAQRLVPAGAAHRVTSVSREVFCSAVRPIGFMTLVRHAAWHPLSDHHVVALSDADELLVFNLQQDAAKPEQRHLLNVWSPPPAAGERVPASVAGAGRTAVSFCFGASASPPSMRLLWDVCTCYVLHHSGAVYALCPVVPYDVRVPAALLETLKSDVDARLAMHKMQLDAQATVASSSSAPSSGAVASVVAELKSQRYWLQEAWAPVADSDAPGPSGGALFYRHVRPHVSGISAESWPVAMQGPVKCSPNSAVEKHLRTAATSVLAVPYALRVDADKARAKPNKRADTQLSTQPFLLRAFSSGHVELLLLDEPVRPRWRPDAKTPRGPGHALDALLLECLHLGFERDLESVDPHDVKPDDGQRPRVLLERDASDPRLVYCLHPTGVHAVNVSWVFSLAAGKRFPALPSSSVRHIFSLSPAALDADAAVIGARVVKNVHFGHLLLLRLSTGSIDVVNVSAASSELIKSVLLGRRESTESPAAASSLPETLASVAASRAASASSASASASASTGVRPFGDLVIEKLEPLPARGTRIAITGSGRALRDVDDAMLAFVLERVKLLQEDVEYVDTMDELIKDRVRLHGELVQSQQERAAAVKRSVEQATQALEALQRKVAQALQAQQNLRKRAAAVMQAVKENQPMLSRAERAFQDELQQLAVEVRRMKPRVAQLTVAGQRAVRQLEHSSGAAATDARALPEDKQQMCWDVLRAETQLLEDARAMIEEMNAALQLPRDK
ncbi:hypothetical protein P43SY_008248 [Pythium insidiosum]|uniref:Nuclear pore complex protein Nup88 n=1 Tax=Pythium insidiosum TaxID=114742 RepID=A0AAD5LIM5_PYTIN|nr:hypothetical protein P43SY_008248 [Pythium insidiosum]